LFQQAKEFVLIDQQRTLKESLFGVYPARLEEIQEHFYGMDQKDVTSRFFQIRAKFYEGQIESMYQVDYIKNMTILAIIGEGGGYEKVIGVGECTPWRPGRTRWRSLCRS
jgi:hypothetical protein